MRYLFFLFLIIPGVVSAQAPRDITGNWIMYFGQNRMSDNWSIHSEVQYRNHTAAPVNIEQLLLRAGMNYHFAPNILISGGYGFIASHDYESEVGKPETKEHRIWQQLILTDKTGRLKFEHRYRIEQRWVNDDFKNRLRYRLMVSAPLNKPVIEKGAVFIGAYNEIFMNTSETFFDRNRLYGGLGYQAQGQLSFQAGMLRQRVNDFGKWYLQFAVFFNPDFRKSS